MNNSTSGDGVSLLGLLTDASVAASDDVHLAADISVLVTLAHNVLQTIEVDEKKPTRSKDQL